MKKFLQILLIRLLLFIGGCVFFGFVGYFLLGYGMYVVTRANAAETGPGFLRSVWAIAIAGGVISNLWFGRLGADD
jgi:hypothetical protein